jgi:hypothetical protein
MLGQSVNLWRMAGADPTAPDFSVERDDESTFKRHYVKEAVRLGEQVGFSAATTRDLIGHMYAIEGGGWGTADTMAGMNQTMVFSNTVDQTSLAQQREKFVPISSGVGYNQLLRATTLYLFHANGKDISTRLNDIADRAQDPARSQALHDKARLVGTLSEMIDKQAAAVPNAAKYYDTTGQPTWDLYAKLATTETTLLPNYPYTGNQLATAVHALNLDKDIGPIIQAEDVRSLLTFAQRNNILGLLNDKVSIMQRRAEEYDKLPDARRQRAVSEVAAAMRQSAGVVPGDQSPEQLQMSYAADSMEKKLSRLHPGKDESLDVACIGPEQTRLVRLIITHASGLDNNPKNFSPDAQRLVGKIMYSHYRGSAGQELLPAALELANLVGEGHALQMLQPRSAGVQAARFFGNAGYKINPIAHHRTASQVLQTIYRQMNATIESRDKPGMVELLHLLDNTTGDSD